MTSSRRDFLKIAGLSLGGAGLGLAGVRLARGEEHAEEAAAAGVRWAMAINIPRWLELDEAARRRVFDACHQPHNVPDLSQLEDPGERERHEIKWIWEEPFENALPTYYHEDLDNRYRDASIPVLCNHCDNPPCVRVCPTQATWKRDENHPGPADGIVMMDMHRCIGCRYCIIACPYGSRSFNFRDPQPYVAHENPEFPRRMRGVVEKCNFCSELIRDGEYTRPPYCIEAAGGALAFGDIRDETSDVRRMMANSYSIRRKPELGTNPHVFYIIGGDHV